MQTFKIIHPSPALKPFVRYYWVLQDSSPGMVSQRTLPTGCMSLVFHRGERLKVVSQNDLQPRCFISGQETSFTDVIFHGKHRNDSDCVSTTHGKDVFISPSVCFAIGTFPYMIWRTLSCRIWQGKWVMPTILKQPLS